MQNPFSKKSTCCASDYIAKKRNLAKITHLKTMPYANFQTASYIVKSVNQKKKKIRKKKTISR